MLQYHTMAKYSSHKSLAIDLSTHVVLTLSLSCLFFLFTGRLSWVFLCVLGGIFIDTDHLIDYFLYYGRRFSLADFVYHSYLDSGKVYIFFHSWELVALLWGLSFMVSWLVPLAAGMTAHLAVDHLSWHKLPLFYFILFRWYHNFSAKKLIPSMISKAKS